jgi:hypothetical protein
MHLLPLLTLWLSISNPAQSVEPSAIPGSGSSANGTSTTTTPSSPADLTLHHAIASKLASGPARGVRKMSADEGEKFFFEDWYFGDESRDSSGELSERDLYHRIWNGTGSSSGNFVTESKPEDEDEDGDGDGDGYAYDYSPAQFIAQSFPFEPSFPPLSGSTLVSASDSASDSASEALSRLEARNFKCPTGTSACTSIGRSDRCCGSGETCEIVTDTGHGSVGCCPSWKKCSGTIGSCSGGYSACASALGGGCCIPGYDCVAGGCKFISDFFLSTPSRG